MLRQRHLFFYFIRKFHPIKQKTLHGERTCAKMKVSLMRPRLAREFHRRNAFLSYRALSVLVSVK